MAIGAEQSAIRAVIARWAAASRPDCVCGRWASISPEAGGAGRTRIIRMSASCQHQPHEIVSIVRTVSPFVSRPPNANRASGSGADGTDVADDADGHPAGCGPL
jgi:hypothetical protein